MIPYPQLHDIRQYTLAGVAVDVLDDSPLGATCACYIKVVQIGKFGGRLDLYCADNVMRTYTVVAGEEKRVDFTEIGKNTTCPIVQVGWSV